MQLDYPRNGWFTSSAIDAGGTALWQQLGYTVSGTGTVALQLRTASSISGLDSATWVGPTGTYASEYLASGSTILTDPQSSGTQHSQYRARLLGHASSTPLFQDVSLLYN